MSAPPGTLSEEIIELREELQIYHPGKVSKAPDRIEFPDNLYIGLFGKTGCGKTSLINSIKYAANGRLKPTKWEQVASQDKAGGQTLYRKLANIINHIFVIDNRGLDDSSTEQAIEELTAQLDGKRSYDKIVDWQEIDEEAEADLPVKGNPVGQHPIGCAVFVFSALHDLEDNTTGLTDVIDFLHIHQGRYPVAVITHVDVAKKADVEGLSAVLRTTGVSDIFQVVNLTKEKPKLDEESQLMLLNFMDRCMTDGDETLMFKYYQRKGVQRREVKEKQRLKIEEQKRKEQEEKLREQERRAEQLRHELQLASARGNSPAPMQASVAAHNRERVATLEDTIMRMNSDRHNELSQRIEADRNRSNCAIQ